MKRILLGGGSVLVLAIAGALIAPSFIDWSKYKQPAIDAAKTATGYDISIDGSIGLSILPRPSLKIENVTVRLPGQTGDQHIASLERLNVAVALFPLLSGKIEVANVQLVKPDINLTYGANGEPEWATPQIRTMMGIKQATDAATPPETDTAPTAQPMAISINDIGIRDGHVLLNDKKSKVKYDVAAINADLSMDTLKGPFDLDVAATYRDVPVKLIGTVGALGGTDMPVNMTFGAPSFGAKVAYSGVAAMGVSSELQGQLDINARNWVPLLAQLTGQAIAAPDEPLAVKGLLTANAQNIVLDNMAFSYGDLDLTGVVKTRLPDAGSKAKPFINARLTSKDTLQVAKLMSSFGAPPAKKTSAQKSAVATGTGMAAVPTIKLPVDLDVEIKAPGVQLAREPFKDVTIKLDAKDDTIRGRMIAAQIPGSGKVDVTAYPGEGGALMATAKINVNDAVKLVRDGLGMAVPAGVPLDKFRDVVLNTDLTLAPQKIEAKTGTIKWSGGDLAFGGSGYKTGANGRGVALVTLGGGKLNLDELIGLKVAPASSAPAQPGAMKQTISKATKNVAVPMDVDFAVSFNELTTGGQIFTDLNAVGKLAGDQLMLSNLEVGNYKGVAVQAKGAVGSIKNLTGLDMKVSAHADNSAQAMKNFGMTPPDLGRDLGAGNLDLAYQGSLDAANIDADVTLWGVSVGAQGPVRDPLGTPGVDNLKLSVSAPNAADAFKILQPGFKATQPLQGPLKLTADTAIDGKVYSLKNVNGAVGSMVVKGDIRADFFGKPSLSGGLTLGDVPLDALMGVSRTTAAAAATPYAGGGGAGPKWSPAPLNTDWMRMMNLDFTIAAKSLTYNLWQLSSPTMAFAVKDGTLSVSDAQAGLFGGKVSGGGTMSAKSAGAPVSMAWNGDMSGVNARSMTNAFMNKAMNKIDGTMGMTFKITANGLSPQAIVGSLDGQAGSSGQNITVNGIDVAKLTTWLTTDLKPTTTLSGIQDSFFGNGATTFEEHNGHYTITNGIINLDQMLFDGAQASLNSTGSVNLPSWTMNTKSVLQVRNPANTPPVNFAINGSLSNPGSSMGKGLFQSYMQQKLQDQVGKLVEKKFGNKLQDLGLGGLLGGAQPQAAPAAPVVNAPVVDPTAAPQNVEPAAQDVPVTAPAPTPAPVQEEPEKVKPEDILIDVLKGLGN